MELLKKYSAMFIPVGIALVAVILIVVTIMMGGSLKKQMAASNTQYNSLKQLLANPLSEKQWEIEKVYQDAHQVDAEAFTAMGTHASQRELITYSMFPAPDANETSDTIFHNFAKAYARALDDLLVRMKAGQPHTAIEMSNLTKSALASGSASSIKEQTDIECKRRAESIHVYATPYAFAGYDYGVSLSIPNRDKAMAECWHWQLAYWIQEDVVQTIVAANENARNELDAPVKRLIAISFAAPDASAIIRLPKVGVGGGGGGGGPVLSAPAAGEEASTGSFALDNETPRYARTVTDNVVPGGSPTGRICNDDIDVVHFSVAVVLRSSSLMPFVKQLCTEKTHTFKGFNGKAAPQQYVHNQITVLGATVSPVDVAMDELAYYRYGDEALYKVNLVCEYIFNKSGYDEAKPAVIKNPPAATPGQTF
jgi:hypothetical protein